MDRVCTIEVLLGDITKIETDVLVNAANTSLLGGGGVDGAIHKAGGPAILEECRKIRSRQGSLNVGAAVATTAGNLPAKYVIHTAGPVWNGGNKGEAGLLEASYVNSLKLAVELGCHAVSFPNISTGIYGFPKEQAAAIAVSTVCGFLRENPGLHLKVMLVCYDRQHFELVHGTLKAAGH
ncbi:MAG: O-acetyl-ADP-ribose deacetylase [Sphingobacteriales bacterium]|nr:MAG: O-acetyl-ADP-ribose deacetylase [Sphingobacteriales bacterium]